jgi:hypothetical protein
VDEIAERFGLEGVYGPLYRLFEVTDDKFNTAVELTAGNRSVPAVNRHCEPDTYCVFTACSMSLLTQMKLQPEFSIL